MRNHYDIPAVSANMNIAHNCFACVAAVLDFLACSSIRHMHSDRHMQNNCGLLPTNAFALKQIWRSELHAAPQQQLLSAIMGTNIAQPCADEIDAIAPKRETAQREMERRIVAQMLTCMDDLSAPPPSAQQQPPADATAAAPESQPAADVHQDQLPSKHVVIIGVY